MTFVLHGTFELASEKFMLWGEGTTVSSRKKAPPDPAPHPFTLSATQLTEYLGTLDIRVSLEKFRESIWLPSSSKMPQPSPEITAMGIVQVAEAGNLSLRPWIVEGLRLPMADVLALLLSPRDHIAAFSSTDLQFWRVAMLASLSLVTGQQVIPTLRKDGFQLLARWRTYPDSIAIAQIIDLAHQLPPICRAFTKTPETAATPASLVNGFLNAIADCAIRQAAATAITKSIPSPGTPGGKWLSALTNADPVVKLNGAQADQLFRDWQTWLGQSDIAGDETFRIAFRLDPPDDPTAQAWSLTYMLQAVDDPSLIVTAEQIWREKGQSLSYLQQRFDHPQERLLAGLGFAARLFPPIEKSLHRAAPEYAVFETAEAFSFLKEIAPLLQGSGFKVLLPRWWGAKATRIRARAKLKTTNKTSGKSILSMDTLVRCEWQIMLGGQPISRAEFERLAALKQPLVQLRGQWVVIDEAQIAAGLKFFEQTVADLPFNEALRLSLGADDISSDAVPLDELETTGWIKKLLATLQNPDTIELLPPPTSLHATLRPYQIRGYSWLAYLRRFGLGACLADDMGLGKTVQSIALLLYERFELRIKEPALLVCPTSVTGNWKRELARFAPDLRVYSHHGIDRLTGDAFATEAAKYDVVITSYPLLARDRKILESVEWATLILDEAQNIKNSATKQAQAARAMRSANRIALTGTPVENRLSELWSIFHFLNPGYLGNEAHFRKSFANPIERVNDAVAAKQLRQMTQPFILRRLKTDPTIINDLPEKLEMKVYCTLTTEQGTLYQAVVEDVLEQIANAEAEGDLMARRGLVLSLLLRLKQVCNHPAQFLKENQPLDGRSGKLARLTEMLEEVYAAGDRALIFTQFAEMGELIRQQLRNEFYDEPLWLHGGTPIKERDSMVARFQAPKGPTVFILSLKAGGVGLNLTRANHVFHFDRWWNPAVENQATDRAFRIGQTRNVQVHKFICAGTLEEKIDEMIESKQALAASVISADETWLTELSTTAIRELVTLRLTDLE